MQVFIASSIASSMENKVEPTGGLEEEIGCYLGLNFIRAPKRTMKPLLRLGSHLCNGSRSMGKTGDLPSEQQHNNNRTVGEGS